MWVDVVLTEVGRSRTGPLRTHRVWSISAVVTVPTDRETLWFEASCAHFGAEAGIVATVAAQLRDLVPEVVAVERDKGWLLTEPLPAVKEDGATEAATVLTPLWAAAQMGSLALLDELRVAGAPWCSRP